MQFLVLRYLPILLKKNYIPRKAQFSGMDLYIFAPRILSITSAISQKLKFTKIGKCIFHSFQHILRLVCKYAHFWTTTNFFGLFWSVIHLVIKATHWKIVNEINYNSKNKKRKKSKSWFFIRCSTVSIFHVNMATFEGRGGESAYR